MIWLLKAWNAPELGELNIHFIICIMYTNEKIKHQVHKPLTENNLKIDVLCCLFMWIFQRNFKKVVMLRLIVYYGKKSLDYSKQIVSFTLWFATGYTDKRLIKTCGWKSRLYFFL